MYKVLYCITKENELIFATANLFKTLQEAKEVLQNTYNNIKNKPHIKNIDLTNEQLIFTDTAENETDEIHKFQILGGV